MGKPIPKTYTCQMCGREFLSVKGCATRVPKFCSKECYAQSLKSENRDSFDYRKENVGPLGHTPWNKKEAISCACKSCGKVYKAIRPRLFCSSECYHYWQRTEEAKEPNRPKAICQNCGIEFYAHGRYKGKDRKFCSKICANQYQQKVKTYENWITKTCPICGEQFTVKQTQKDKIYCSRACCDQGRIKYTEGKRVGDRQTARLRRERLTKPIMENYLKALKIIQKDKCAYCGEPMNGHGTIEHLVPVSSGGNNDWWNIVLCCKHCNSQKGSLSLTDYSFKYCEPAIVDRTMLISYYAHKLATKLNKNING